MALDPTEIARKYVDEELAEIAITKAEAALDAIGRAFAPDDKQYLTARAERWQKWAATARKQMEKHH